MSVIRLCDKVPDVYSNTSRDFQLISRLYDCIINGIKFDADSVKDVIDTKICDNKLLPLLQEKVGFFSNKQITDEKLRTVLMAFPDIVKWKGSLEGIERAVRVFLKLNNIKSSVYIYKVNKSENNPYIIDIGLDMDFTNTVILDEILRYILPTGYSIRYSFYSSIDKKSVNLESKIGINLLVVKDSVNSLIRGSYISFKNPTEDFLIGSVGAQQIAIPDDSSFCGTFNTLEDLKEKFPEDKLKEEDIGKIYTIIGNDGGFNPDNFHPHSVIVKKIYNSVKNEVQIAYVELTENAYEHQDVFSSALYGYYSVEKSENEKYYGEEAAEMYGKDNLYYGNFYLSHQNEYVLQISESIGQDSLEIENDTIPENAIIKAKANLKLYDNTSGIEWISKFDANEGNYLWTHNYASENGIEIQGEPDSGEHKAYIVPKEGMTIYRPSIVNEEAGQEYYISEAIWKCEYFNNSYIWSDMIVDKDEINSVKVYKHVSGSTAPTFEAGIYYRKIENRYIVLLEEPDDWNTSYTQYYYFDGYDAIVIEGTPYEAQIDPKYTDACYSTNGRQWYSEEESGSYSWVEIDDYSNYVQIIGDPRNGAYIIPKQDKYIYIDSPRKVWKGETSSYDNPVGKDSETDTSVLYIDIPTSNGYKYTKIKRLDGTYKTGYFERVMLYKRAENVYELTKEELQDMINSGSLKPAFKNDRTIFRDIYGNILLL